MKSVKITIKEPAVLMDVVRNAMGYHSNSRSRNIIKAGQVSVGGEIVKIPTKYLSADTDVEILPGIPKVQKKKPGFEVSIVYEDDKMFIFEKPALKPLFSKKNIPGMDQKLRKYVTEQDPSNDLFFINPFPMTASGLVLAAKNLRAQKGLEAIWKEAEVRYYTVCKGILKKDKLVIEEGLAYNKMGKAYVAEDGRHIGKTEVESLKSNGAFSLLRVVDVTKLKSQLNAHLAHVGLTIIGDMRDEGKKRKNQMHLHLFSIRFESPFNQEKIDVKTPVPKEFLSLVKSKS